MIKKLAFIASRKGKLKMLGRKQMQCLKINIYTQQNNQERARKKLLL